MWWLTELSYLLQALVLPLTKTYPATVAGTPELLYKQCAIAAIMLGTYKLAIPHVQVADTLKLADKNQYVSSKLRSQGMQLAVCRGTS